MFDGCPASVEACFQATAGTLIHTIGRDRDGIAEGIAQMEAGKGKPAEQAFEELRSRLGFSSEV